MSFTTVPTVSNGDSWSAAQHNTYLRDNMAALFPYTTAGDLAYASASNALSRLAKPSVDSVLKNTSAGTPSWLAYGELGRDFASVYHNTTQTAVNGVSTPMAFNSEYSDLPGWHSNSTNNSRITVSATGYYQASAYIQYGGVGGSGGYWDTLIFAINTANYAEDRRYQSIDAFAKMFVTTSPIAYLTAGQYLQVYLEQNSGGDRTVVANVKFSVWRVA